MAKQNTISLLKSRIANLKKQRALATTPKAKQIVNRRIQELNVRIKNAQKQPKALKPAKTKGSLPPAKTRPTGSASSRRAQAAAKQARAAQGTAGGKRVGQPAGAANRMYGANTVNKAVKRAVNRTAARTALKTVGRLLAGRDDGSGSALLAAKMTSDTINAVRGSTAKERNAKKKTKTAKRGMSNIPPKEGTGKGSPTDKPKAEKTPKAPTTVPKAPKTPARSTPTKAPVKPKTKLIPKKDRMESASKDKRMAAWAKANAKMIRKSGTAKQRAILDKVENKPKKSAALQVGYPGNRNY